MTPPQVPPEAPPPLLPSAPLLPSLIALIGFMGAGKTTVGRLLAEKLGYDFVDTDDLIVARSGVPIADVFQRKGEAFFRRLETEALLSLASRSRTVMAAGGGAPGQESNQAFFRNHAATFHLRVTMQNARGRTQALGGAVRPLLSQEDSVVQRLYESRLLIYEALGQPVETDGRTPMEVVDQIIQLLRNPRESPRPVNRSSADTP
jgi:shikimate kinase